MTNGVARGAGKSQRIHRVRQDPLAEGREVGLVCERFAIAFGRACHAGRCRHRLSPRFIEAALVVSVVLAASHGVRGRSRWVAGGVVAGVLGAMVVAAFTGEISAALAGIGQEVFDASVLFGAVVMLGWHNIWMNRHGREMADEAKSIGAAVRAGARPLYALAIVTGLAVLREGSEIVLFVYGIVAAQGTGVAGIFSGGALGLLG